MSVVLDTRGGGLLAVLHCGGAVGGLSGSDFAEVARMLRAPVGDSPIDVPDRVSLVPTPAECRVGALGLTGSRVGRDFSAIFTVTGENALSEQAGAAGWVFSAVDAGAGLSLTVQIELTASGVRRPRAAFGIVNPSTAVDLWGMVLAIAGMRTSIWSRGPRRPRSHDRRGSTFSSPPNSSPEDGDSPAVDRRRLVRA